MKDTPETTEIALPSTATTEPCTASSADPRFSSLPVRDVLRLRMKDLGRRNVDLQKALDYPMPNVIAMLKTGSMRLPEAKAVKAADYLKIDRVFLLLKVIAENDIELYEAISTVMGDRLVTTNELKLIQYIRAALDGHDPDLANSEVFTRAVRPALNSIAKQESALAAAALKRTDK